MSSSWRLCSLFVPPSTGPIATKKLKGRFGKSRLGPISSTMRSTWEPMRNRAYAATLPRNA